MSRIMITSGPTRQFLDPVRYLTNASSGKMGACLAQAALQLGHEVVVVSGPVDIDYPEGVELHQVVTTDEMLASCESLFGEVDGVIGAAAPCDYKPHHPEPQKIGKTGKALVLELSETPDIVATLGAKKRPNQWVVGFALETEDARFRSLVKLEKKSCDLIVSNGPQAMNADENEVEVLDRGGRTLGLFRGSKLKVAEKILDVIDRELISSDG